MNHEPLHTEALRARLAELQLPYKLDVLTSVPSTNDALAAAARDGAPDRTVLLAEEQTAGRGRLARTWSSPRGAGLYLSVLFRPEGVPAARLPWLSLLTARTAARTVTEHTGLATRLKWPNDILVGPGEAKCAGILADAVDSGTGGVVIGIGLNTAHAREELDGLLEAPGHRPTTSLTLEGAKVARADLAVAFLHNLHRAEASWRAAGGDPEASGLRAAYEADCATVGAAVTLELPDGTTLLGDATGLDDQGRLLVRTADGTGHALSAGDVVRTRQRP
ncbi:biotin--[acetyl-CoA-carboxylase] ligase [Streptomyces sp. NPDC002851]